MESENMLAILLGLLIVVSAVQAYQLVNLKDAISSGSAAAASSAPQAQYSSGAQASNSAAGAPSASKQPLSALDNAPNMVGGC